MEVLTCAAWDTLGWDVSAVAKPEREWVDQICWFAGEVYLRALGAAWVDLGGTSFEPTILHASGRISGLYEHLEDTLLEADPDFPLRGVGAFVRTYQLEALRALAHDQ
ncbi:hypothetical protein [Nocardia puris]|uniref:hypothetical protein n=1 Tax=Nocardia puris TaxID=208602 RepID=UPI0012F4C81B|nr:hypothetical protein [Nocardia puris]